MTRREQGRWALLAGVLGLAMIAQVFVQGFTGLTVLLIFVTAFPVAKATAPTD